MAESRIKKISRAVIPKYFRESYKELKKVKWPSRKEAWKLTFAVTIFTIFFGLVIALADFVLTQLVERILL